MDQTLLALLMQRYLQQHQPMSDEPQVPGMLGGVSARIGAPAPRVLGGTGARIGAPPADLTTPSLLGGAQARVGAPPMPSLPGARMGAAPPLPPPVQPPMAQMGGVPGLFEPKINSQLGTPPLPPRPPMALPSPIGPAAVEAAARMGASEPAASAPPVPAAPAQGTSAAAPAGELPYQTYERLSGKHWAGGRSSVIQALMQHAGVGQPAGSADANLALQRALLAHPELLQ
jgi:hypothetical protein